MNEPAQTTQLHSLPWFCVFIVHYRKSIWLNQLSCVSICRKSGHKCCLCGGNPCLLASLVFITSLKCSALFKIKAWIVQSLGIEIILEMACEQKQAGSVLQMPIWLPSS